MKRWSNTFNRRDLLKVAGCTLTVPPFLSRAFAGEDATDQLPRLILLMQSNGTSQPDFWPSTEFSSPILDHLFATASLREKATIIKGIYNDSGGFGNAHDQGFSGLYSGYRSLAALRGDTVGGGISIDQFLKQNLDLAAPFPTLHCGVMTSTFRAAATSRYSFSHTGPGQQVAPETDVYALYEKFFGNALGDATDASSEATQARLRLQGSVLDSVSGDLSELGRRLGPSQRQKVDLHLTSLREFENRLGAHVHWVRDSCDNAQPKELNVPDVGDEHTETVTQLMFEFITLVCTCNLTRVVTFQFGKGGEHFFYSWLGIDKDGHNDIAHQSIEEEQIRRWTLQVNQWYARMVGQLAAGFDAVEEPAGTALDNSLIVWGNEIATGVHDLEDIPIVLLGQAAGRLKRTGYLVDEGEQDYHRLGCTLLNLMGHPSEGFGEEPNVGVLSGLSM